MNKKLIFTLYLMVALPLQLHAGDASRQTAAKPLVVARTTMASSHQLTLKQLGARFSMALRGVDSRDGVNFHVRADEVVTQARLKLLFSYSPALLSHVSHINVLLNGEVAASLELPKKTSTSTLERLVDLPPRFITEYNKIDFQLIGHYTDKCEDPSDSSLWANISNLSTLELTSESVRLNNDLRILPRPFMDPRDTLQLQLPVVFVGHVDNEMLEAAGTVSSWFGAIAGDRGAIFPASLNTLPAKGHAVVFVTGHLPLFGMAGLAGRALPALSGPTLSIVVNPNDPDGKLLLISGRDSKELRMAATALTIGTAALEGSSMLVKPLNSSAVRRPYDAPNWLASHRPVRFSELSHSAAMNVSGHNPSAIRLNMRVPPDLFRWNDSGIPVDLKYRYTPQAHTSANASLLVNFNEQLVKSVPLLPFQRPSNLQSMLHMVPQLSELLPDKTLSMETRLNVPMYTVAHQSQMQLNFKYNYSKEGECRDILVEHMRGAIEPDSWIDISGYPHYMAMPNLAVFSDSGFPFTRLADLSETAVILSDSPSLQEYTTYLGVMGRLGQSTGYPANAVSVAEAGQIDNFARKDLLLIAAGDNQPLLKTWRIALQIQPSTQRNWKFFGIDFNPFHWALASAVAAPPSLSEPLCEGATGRAVIRGFESPLARGRSAVLIWGAQPDDLDEALLAMSGGDGFVNQVKGAVSVIRGKSIDSVPADSVYYIGSLPWITYVRWQLSENFLIFLVFSLASAMLLSALAYFALKGMAKKRLL